MGARPVLGPHIFFLNLPRNSAFTGHFSHLRPQPWVCETDPYACGSSPDLDFHHLAGRALRVRGAGRRGRSVNLASAKTVNSVTAVPTANLQAQLDAERHLALL